MKEEYDKYIKNISKLGKTMSYGLYTSVVNKLFGGTIKGKIKARHVNDDINKFFDEL